MKTEIS